MASVAKLKKSFFAEIAKVVKVQGVIPDGWVNTWKSFETRCSQRPKMDSNSNFPHVSLARIISFVSVFSTILLAATWFVCATWNHFWSTATLPAWQIIFPVLTVVFVATTILGRRYFNLELRLAYRISAIWLGVLNYTFFAAVAAWIFSAIAALLSFHVEPKLVAAIFFGCAVVTSIYGFVNASWLRVTRVTVGLANLSANWDGRSVALVTDLHLGNFRGPGFARRVVAAVQRLQAEAIFISGDMFDGSKADLDACLEPWKDISAPAGIYFVTGNHEEFTDRLEYLEAVKRAGIRVLNNEKVEINGLQLVGVHDAELTDPQFFHTLLRRAGLDRNRASILLAHRPINLAISEDEGISLQLSGHTHGGQLWPWTQVAALVHRQFNHGLNQLGKLQVLTSNGVGTWGAPMRVGTVSEIILIQLESVER
jgi:predicted MPP superfamily phosphohydrolase